MLPPSVRQELAERLRDDPTVPPGASRQDAASGALWPSAFCAFKGCSWQLACGCEADLGRHLLEHEGDLEPIRSHLARPNDPAAYLSIYNRAVSEKCRKGAPLAGPSLDRTALLKFNEAIAEDRAQALCCFSCGGVHPYVAEVAEQGDIQWCQPLLRSSLDGPWTFMGQTLQKAVELIGLQSYLARYDIVGDQVGAPGSDARPRLTDHEDFRDWSARLPEVADGELLCCPEDRSAAASKPKSKSDRPVACGRTGSARAARGDPQTNPCAKSVGCLSAGAATIISPEGERRLSATPTTCGLATA